MKLLFKILFTLALIGLMYYCFHLVGIEKAKPITDVVEEGPNHSLIVSLYGAIMLLAAGLAVVFATTIIPLFAERAAGLVYGSAEKIEAGPHALALARAAQGDYEGAIEAYENVIANKDAEDTLALSEIAHLYADKLGFPEKAVERLAIALERDWEPDKAAFLTFRLADLYWKNLGELGPARQLLEQVIERMPDTTHAANAMHRVREIDTRERELEEAAFLAGEGAPPEEGASIAEESGAEEIIGGDVQTEEISRAEPENESRPS